MNVMKIPHPLRPGEVSMNSYYRNFQSLPLTLSEPVDLAWGHVWQLSNSREFLNTLDHDLDRESEKYFNVVHNSPNSTNISSFITITYSTPQKMDSTFCWFGRTAQVQCHMTEPGKLGIENSGSVTPWRESHELIIWKYPFASTAHVGVTLLSIDI